MGSACAAAAVAWMWVTLAGKQALLGLCCCATLCRAALPRCAMLHHAAPRCATLCLAPACCRCTRGGEPTMGRLSARET